MRLSVCGNVALETPCATPLLHFSGIITRREVRVLENSWHLVE